MWCKRRHSELKVKLTWKQWFGISEKIITYFEILFLTFKKFVYLFPFKEKVYIIYYNLIFPLSHAPTMYLTRNLKFLNFSRLVSTMTFSNTRTHYIIYKHYAWTMSHLLTISDRMTFSFIDRYTYHINRTKTCQHKTFEKILSWIN